MDKIELVETERHPLCPHCSGKLSSMNWHKVKGGAMGLGYVAMYSCPHCKKLLGSSGSSNG